MRRVLLPLLLVAAALATGFSGCRPRSVTETVVFPKGSPAAGQPRAPSPDELLAIERSADALDRKVAAEIRAGSETLKQVRERMRQAGVPSTAAELQAPAPPADQNAATAWRSLTSVLEHRPLTKEQDEVFSRLERPHGGRPGDLEAARKALAERADLVQLIREATDREPCVFIRNWELGTDVPFPEFPALRKAARLIRAQALVLSADGGAEEAVAFQARGLRAAQHGASDPTVIGLLVGIAVDAITLSGYEAMLLDHPDDAPLLDAVYRTLRARRPHFDVRHALGGEGPSFGAAFERTRREGPSAALAFAEHDPDELKSSRGRTSPPHPALMRAEQMSPEQLRVWRAYLNACEARYLDRLLRLRAAVDRPAEFEKEAEALADLWRHRERDPVGLYAATLLPVLSKVGASERRIRTKEEILLAADRVLIWRRQHAGLPITLQQAAPEHAADLLTGGELRYRREGDGFVIFSIGESGKYDGGRPGQPVPTKENGLRFPLAIRR